MPRPFALLLGLPLVLGLLAAAAPPPPHPAIFDALTAELARAKTLSTEGFESPYFVAYLLRDLHSLDVSGKIGSIYSSRESRSRWLYTDVRVGNYDFDSSTLGGHGGGRVAAEDDANALRAAAWLQTDAGYKSSLKNYLWKKSKAIDEPAKKDRPADFSRETPVVVNVARAPFSFDRAEAEGIVRRTGATMKPADWIVDSSVSVSVRELTRYLANSEGTRLTETAPLWSYTVSAQARADDGETLHATRTLYSTHRESRPGDAALAAVVKDLVDDLSELRHAEILTPYSGPAVLAQEPTGVFFHEAIGHRLEGHRDPEAEHSDTFHHRLGERLLPAFLSVRDDPSMQSFEGTDLLGHYAYDDEGVAAQSVSLIESGVLKGFLFGRTVTDGVAHSNGHGRNGYFEDIAGRLANLSVETSAPIPDADLEKRLVEEAARQGKPWGIWIEEVEPVDRRSGSQVFHGVPTKMYKIDTHTGAKTRVRGAELIGTPLTVLGKVLATGTKRGVANTFCHGESGSLPVSTIAPAILLQELELQKTPEHKRKPPVLPPPAFDAAPKK